MVSLHKLDIKSSGLPASHTPDMKSVCSLVVPQAELVHLRQQMFRQFVQVKIKLLRLSGENSGNLISQNDFLLGKISIFESEFDGGMKQHETTFLTEENVSSQFTSL